MTERHPPLRSYGRTKARTLKPRQEALLETLLPRLAIPAGPIDLDALFKRPSPLAGEGREGGASADLADESAKTSSWAGGVALEIGFGGGEHLVAQAAAHPDMRFIGVEPFVNGVASCLRHIEESGVANVRLHQGDARDILPRLPDASLNLVYVLFPDPWPKARHHKRRLIQPGFIADLARVLAPGGEVRFATDWRDYAAWAIELFLKNAAFAWTAERAEDWRRPWPGHVATRYEKKRLGDCSPVYLRFSRVNLA
ncbi:MAG: tRNA (guanosine(46)-N7)-methyltransferase TrmB [Hydrogenophilaceae bacterium]|jgi:tRNA (guanine-N7-)-methyltransferase|nr:tRNA (guanosine(46)-N7)-methyltransferase TrmB [Hydrogenophilaceae bacterium]